MKPYLSVIIPAYNEAKRLPLTLIDVERHLSRAEYSSEIIVVNDGSSDQTAEIVKRLQNLIPNLRLINNEKNHGKGWAVRQGMIAAKGNLRLFMDADNSVSVDQFNKMIPYFRDGYEIVIGSRDVPGAKLMPPQPFYKRFIGNIGNLIIQALILRGIWDTQCGFKCFTEEAALQIFRVARVNRWGFDVEVLALAKEFGFKIKEIPVIWADNGHSKVGLVGYWQALFDVLRVRFLLWRKKYGEPTISDSRDDE
jgi:dolichyl-phosphate beta-glucosyltransferase